MIEVLARPPDQTPAVLSLRLLVVAVLYFLSGQIGMLIAVDGSVITPVWPPSGVALVAILLFGYPMALGALLGSLVLNLSLAFPPLTALFIALGNNLEYIGGAFLLRRVSGFHPALDRPRDVFALTVLAATLATSFSVLPGLITLKMVGLIAWDNLGWLMLKWWQGGMSGVLLMAPLLLVWLRPQRSRLSLPQAAEALALLVLLLAVWFLIFDIPSPGERAYYPGLLAVLPFSIWAALRFGMRGITLVNLINAFLGIWGSAHGTGPFAGVSPMDSLVRWGLFHNVVSMTGLFLAASSEEQQSASQALKRSHLQLERRVQERTAELARINEGLEREVAERKRLEVALIVAEEEQQRKFGMELHDGLGQHLTSVAFFGAAVHQKLTEQSRPESVAAGRIVSLINQAIDMVRTLAHGLYPPALKSGGLAVVLRQLAESTQTLKGIPCHFLSSAEAQVKDPHLAINLYRIAQEAVNNATKYSQASAIWIRLELTDERLHRLVISDDGVGFSPSRNLPGSEPDQTAGMGLNNMGYRASLLGGRLDIDSHPQQGTRITVLCPARS